MAEKRERLNIKAHEFGMGCSILRWPYTLPYNALQIKFLLIACVVVIILNPFWVQ